MCAFDISSEFSESEFKIGEVLVLRVKLVDDMFESKVSLYEKLKSVVKIFEIFGFIKLSFRRVF